MSIKIKEFAELVSENPGAEIIIKNQGGKTIDVELDVLEQYRYPNNMVLIGEFYDTEDYNDLCDERDDMEKKWSIAEAEKEDLKSKCEIYEEVFSEIKEKSYYAADDDLRDLQSRLERITLLINDLRL